MAEEKDTAAPAKRTASKTGRRKKPEAEHAARAAPQDKDTGSKAQEILEQARTEPKPEWEVAEQVVLLPLDRLRPFKNHPFKVNDEDELMQDTIDSIMAGGVINPILVRPAEDGKFEVVSGHRRFRASELAGKADIKAIVREMDDDTAVITMVDSNLQRENILPSERAFSYRMKMEALTHQGQRTDPTLRQVGAKFRTAELVGQPAGDSARQVQRFIRLTELIPQLLDMVDRKELAFNPAVELSYLKPHEQEQFLDAMDYAQATPSLSQAQRLKRLSQNGECTLEAMYEIIVTIVQGLIDNLPMLLEAALALIEGLAQGILDAIPVLIEALPEVIDSIVTFFLDAIPQIIDTGIQLLTSLVEALPEIITAIPTTFKDGTIGSSPVSILTRVSPGRTPKSVRASKAWWPTLSPGRST